MDSKHKNSIPKRLFSRKDLNNSDTVAEDNYSENGNKRLNTDPLDHAMKELLDICQLYNEKLSILHSQKLQQAQQDLSNNGNDTTMTTTTKDSCVLIKSFKNANNNYRSVDGSDLKNGNSKQIMTTNCDIGIEKKEDPSSMMKIGESNQQHIKSYQLNTNKSSNDNDPNRSIEKLQQRQGELQSQLDEVLRTAKELESKQKRKLKCIREDEPHDDQFKSAANGGPKKETNYNNDSDDDDELLEFQQIENELRISELNRQLDATQEELRIRLYKRLFSPDSSGKQSHEYNAQNKPNQHQTARYDSIADGSSPSSSSSSEEPTLTTTTTAATISSSTSDLNTSSSANGIVADSNGEGAHHDDSFRSYVSDRRHRTSPPRDPIHLTKQEQRQKQIDAAAAMAAEIAFYAESNSTTVANDEFLMNYKDSKQDQINGLSATVTPTINHSDLDSIVDGLPSHEISTQSTSKIPDQNYQSNDILGQTAELSSIFNKVNQLSDIVMNAGATTANSNHHLTSSICPSNHRNNSASSDLERIEEGEEDCQGYYYSNSDRFRSIYMEKSPIIYGSTTVTTTTTSNDGKFKSPTEQQQQGYEKNLNQVLQSSIHQVSHQASPRPAFQQATHDYHVGGGSTGGHKGLYSHQDQHSYQHSHHLQQQQQQQQSQKHYSPTQYNSLANDARGSGGGYDRSFKAVQSDCSAGKSKITNRPLTLYLPKPDEEIDLLDHVQALGHDLNIISSHLKLDATNAHGYLWKSCSNNSKKWLKRYFFFDRSKKVLSYYKSEGHLVKKQCSAKNFIRFEEISDVYVDHKLSRIGEKGRSSSSSSKRNYVFVLATTKRKYLLSSPMAQIMRAWIDILFTAAKANDFFQQLTAEGAVETQADDNDNDDDEEEDPAAYESFGASFADH